MPDPAIAPATTVVGSAEFNAAVAVAVQSALAGQPQQEPRVVTVAAQPAPIVQATSIDTTKPGPDDLTVAFTRFCTFQGSGYQRTQMAGFPRKAANQVIASGAAILVHDPRIHDDVRARRAA